MPKVKIEGEWRAFPFDEDTVAALLYNGYDVQPDDGTDEQQLQHEQLLVSDRLQRLWGGKNLQTEDNRWSLDAPPSLREDDSFGKRMMAPGTRNEGMGRLVKPNPTIDYTMPRVTLKMPPITRNM